MLESHTRKNKTGKADTRKWYAVYTRPRWEKKVNHLLEEQGIETYCPLNKVRRKWSDRVKVVEEPLFKSYVFVRIREKEKTPVRMTTGVMNFVYANGKPGVVKEREILTIRRFLDEFEEVEVTRLNLLPDARVKIKSGIFMDKEAIVKKVMNRKVELVIESLGFHLKAVLDNKKIQLIPKEPINL